MATCDCKWWFEGTEPRYLDLDASLAKFCDLVNEALQREQLSANSIPVTIMLSRTVSFHGRLAVEIPHQVADLVAAIWEEGNWQVFESTGEPDSDDGMR